MSGTSLQKAQLIPVDPNTKQAQLANAITVHFNPETLRLSCTVTVKADTGSKNSSDQASQQNSSSSAKLAVDLVFDTTDLFEDRQDGADVVQQVTSKIIAAFVAPPAPNGTSQGQPIPANPCLFLWGTFQFVGLVDSYNETLEFFSASDVPLRAAVSISLTESRYKVTNIPQRVPGQAQPLPPGTPIGPALSSAGMDPTDWRAAPRSRTAWRHLASLPPPASMSASARPRARQAAPASPSAPAPAWEPPSPAPSPPAPVSGKRDAHSNRRIAG